MPHPRNVSRLLIPLIAPFLLATCGGPSDERLAEMAQQSVQQQAKQNEQMAAQNRQIAEATKELVTADAQARADALQLQREIVESEAASRQALQTQQQTAQSAIQEERVNVDRQRAELDQERKQIAGDRHREPILAAVISTFGLLLAALLPLLLCGYVLHGLRSRSDAAEDAVSELLIHELTDEQTPLLTNSIPLTLDHQPPLINDTATKREPLSETDSAS